MSYATDTGGIFSAFGLSLIQNADGSETIHERTRLREFFTARLVAAVSNAARVHTDPTLAIQARPDQFELPAFAIHTQNENSALFHTQPHTVKRELELVVSAIGAETEDVDVERLVDSLALGVETLILNDDDWPRSVYGVDLTSSDRTFTSDGVRRFGSCRLTFLVTYTTELPEIPGELP